MNRLVFITTLCTLVFLPSARAQCSLTFTDGGEIVGPSGKVSVGHGGENVLWNCAGLADKLVDIDPATQQPTFSAKLDDKALTKLASVLAGKIRTSNLFCQG